MSRRILTVALLGGALLPLLAAVMIFGCCVLPFHHLVHKVLPLCSSAAQLLAHADDRVAPRDALPVAPKPHPKRVDNTDCTLFPASLARCATNAMQGVIALSASSPQSRPRNAVSPGALRVDDDVGLSTLLATFRI